MAYTVNPLGKVFIMNGIVTDIQLWLRKETQKELDGNFVKNLVNYATMDVAEILSGAGSSDYSKDVNISDAASSATTSIVESATYTDATRNIEKTTHGLVAADIGKRIAAWIGTTRAAIAEIESITDVNNFKITKALGGNGTANYAVFSSHSSTMINLSQYRISHVTKVFDSINKEVIECGDKEFDNLYRFPTKQKSCYYNVRGQFMHLRKGDEVPAFGDLTMTFDSYPQITTEDDDNLDIRDMYIPLVILKAKNFCLEHLGQTAPESLTNAIDQKSREVRENIQREKEIAAQKNYGK
jgi:hypothetical protein